MPSPEGERRETTEPYSQAPVTLAGGFQRFNLAEPNPVAAPTVSSSEDEARSSKCPRLSRFAIRFPRTYHVVFKIVGPLFFLIGISFLCGYLLALWESDAEIETNDGALADIVDEAARVIQLAELASATPTICLRLFEGDTADFAALEKHMEDCGTFVSSELNEILDEFITDSTIDAYESITFDWIVCSEGIGNYATKAEQAEQVIDAWLADFNALEGKYDSQNLTDAQDRAIEEATGHDGCRVNTASGALFWFTIMTTIGYGNTAPVTAQGRALVCTLGFVSILIFTALIGQAGYIFLIIADDFFRRCNLQRLTQGILAAILWFTCFATWILVLAGTIWSWSRTRDGVNEMLFDFSDAVWFAYITITTVGLGDIHIPHDQWRPVDMFYIPLVCLIGFTLLANFLLKLSDVLTSNGVSQDRSLEGILERSRRKQCPEETEVNGQGISAGQEGLSVANTEDPLERDMPVGVDDKAHAVG